MMEYETVSTTIDYKAHAEIERQTQEYIERGGVIEAVEGYKVKGCVNPQMKKYSEKGAKASAKQASNTWSQINARKVDGSIND